MKPLLMGVLVGIVITGCRTRESELRSDYTDAQNVVFYFPAEALEMKSENDFSPEKRTLLESLRKNSPVSTDSLASLFYQEQIRRYEAVSRKPIDPIFKQKLDAELVALVEVANGATDPHDFKVRFENAMAKSYGREFFYNSAATSLPAIFEQQAQQCYSGTVLYNYLALRSSVPFKKNLVTIFEYGHVLPGYLRHNFQGRSQVVGIESTMLGRAPVVYNQTWNMEIFFDTTIFALSDIFRDDLKNPEAFKSAAIQITNEKYMVTLNKALAEASERSIGSDAAANSTLLAFGAAAVVPGNQQRVRSDDNRTADLQDRGSQLGSELLAKFPELKQALGQAMETDQGLIDDSPLVKAGFRKVKDVVLQESENFRQLSYYGPSIYRSDSHLFFVIHYYDSKRYRQDQYFSVALAPEDTLAEQVTKVNVHKLDMEYHWLHVYGPDFRVTHLATYGSGFFPSIAERRLYAFISLKNEEVGGSLPPLRPHFRLYQRPLSDEEYQLVKKLYEKK